ncbi:uncharacterized protein FIBRA_02432 [Fibroporia radiculosa]|uniref:SH3 domain-containing protein n=1 Tax=Fibroporia radiculosa TaxID=599839 RepID=J4HUY1_9APHY|nr:uncharacterized protein FIBRA_02432 [Fibroporia radiculosa]CCM00402.1 predicted protein [Fibroporia radiculosa]
MGVCRLLCVLVASAFLFPSHNGALAGLPLVDFDRMGTVGITGSFAGLGLSDNNTISTVFDSSTATVLSRSADGSLTALGSTDVGGRIAAGCVLGDVYYIGGTFTTIGGVSANNVASYASATGSFSGLGSGGPDASVNALFCDVANNRVWVGGKFSSPGPSVAIWSPQSSQWSPPPFGGLSGAAAEVLSISPNYSSSGLFFSGSFITTFGNGSASLNATNNPNVPYSPGASPFSSSLVPIPLQNAQIIAEPSSTDPNYDNIDAILCPSGSDGPGHTWFAEDGDAAVITVRAFSLLSARGIRLGNTFLDGRGTTGFSVTTIPDNTVRTLSYIDPTTGANLTCTNPCPLLDTSSIPYQDFLFDEVLDITGFQLTLSQWQGAGPGLHILQLLSSGAFASAIASNNTESCYAPIASNVSFTGKWTQKEAATDIPATVEAVLVSTVSVGTTPPDSPSMTWMPYVSASGDYEVYMVIPGCTEFQDCALRTSVQVTVFPGGGLQPSVSTISQQNSEDESTLVYRGPIVPSSPDFVTTISMTLSAKPNGAGQNGEYELVAGDVQLVLTNANITGGIIGGGNATDVNSTNGFGLFEWPLTSKSTVNATSILSNATETSIDGIAFALFMAMGGDVSLTSGNSHISAVGQHSSGTVFIGGNFNLSSGSASGVANIVTFKDGVLTSLPSDGLNGAVTSLYIVEDMVYVGGAFDDTVSPSNAALKGVAMFDVQQNKWVSLGAGVNGVVTSLDYSDNLLLLTGNFTEVYAADASIGRSAMGFAAWNNGISSWANSGGFLVGNMTFVGNVSSVGDGQSQSQLIAGNVNVSAQYGSTGFVLVQNGAGGSPQVAPLGVQLDSVVPTTSVSNVQRRHSHLRRSAASWVPKINVLRLFRRETSPALAPLPAAPAPLAPAVLSGAFWTNSSSSQEMVILGGNFTFSSTSGSVYQNVAIYDNATASIKPLQGSQINGTVRDLLVQGDYLYIGGEFTLEGTNADGFAIYDLATEQWAMSGVEALQPSSGTSVVVRSVTTSPSQSNIIVVAGSFAQAGSIACRSICFYDASTEQWSALGNGIQGDVTSVSYAGDDWSTIIAAGSIALADNTPANVATFILSNSTWATMGDDSLPGPVTAVAVNDGNISSVFVAGRTSDGTSAFLYYWDGQVWAAVGSTLEPSTDVMQLIMVPLQNTHAANSIIQSDRMLMVSGYLADTSFGNASSALFDGETFIPYIVSETTSGLPGIVSGLVYSLASFSFTQTHFLATGVVILISIAIAAGIVFLLALIGILWTLFSRRDDKLVKYDAVDVPDDDDSTHRPSSLLAHINAATRTTILGDPLQHNQPTEKDRDNVAGPVDQDPFGPDGSNYVRAETPSDAVIGIMNGEETSRPAYARYSFDGVGEGELPLSVGQEIEVLDDGDAA